jgi:hypothetical protein
MNHPSQILPIRVCYIIGSQEDLHIPIEKTVSKFCKENNLSFGIRKYNNIKYEEDCNYIEALPAFHIYRKNNYDITFYPEEKPIEILQNYRTVFLEKQRQKEEKKQARRIFLSHALSFFQRKSKTSSHA